MKVYRSLLAIFLFFVIIYAFKGYLNPSQYSFEKDINATSGATLGTSSGSTSTSSKDLALTVVENIKNTGSSGGYKTNRDQLSPVVGKNTEDSKNGRLTTDGVFFHTNSERLNQSILILKRSSILDKSAEIKLNDMFANQYFEHVSPSGSGVSDLVNAVDYKFLVVGENLALGNFAGDAKVVAAWMASPGHRENILDKRYTEIGVAVGYGMYKGRMQWLAVQHFARPLSSCPSPSSVLKEKITNAKNSLVQIEGDITSMKAFVDRTESSNQNFESIINSYNALVNDYNDKLRSLRFEISNYNSQVNNFNSCLDDVTTSVQ